DPKSVELSVEFVGRWSTLISTSNWEKGRIIAQWRQALQESEAPVGAYSDEAWSRRVGGVSPQHVGRLRRVYERFGDSFATYKNLYWSHFLAVLDWDDAEMWLEGAVQSQWSVSQMRRTRWEAMGKSPDTEPQEADVVAVEPDEDYAPLAEFENDNAGQDGSRAVAEGPRPDGPDFGDESDSAGVDSAALSEQGEEMETQWEAAAEISAESPFAKLPSLPVDLAEALEQFKLAIIRHRADEWADVSQEDVQQALDALKAFAAL
ncbi:MAG: hypothetical protein KDA45_16425, partial [Planctomycetales bacterium]|nr:hypothetical protein [Planctomycetales bacterium]